MTKNITHKEIDLLEFGIIIWAGKLKIILITFLTILLALFISERNSTITKKSFLAQTEILPNSTFNDYQYAAYNTFINAKNSSLNSLKLIQVENSYENFEVLNSALQINFKDSLTIINSGILYDLFIKKLQNQQLFIEGIKKFDLINKENYENNNQYIKAVKQLASSIKIYPKTEKKNLIEFEIYDKIDWENFLLFIQENANIEIRDYLIKQFNSFIKNASNFKKYEIEDIEFEIENGQDQVIISQLKKLKKKKLENKNIKRLKILFNNTPVIKSDNFTAGKINIQSTNYEDKNKKLVFTTKKIVMIATILGLILGIIFVIMLNNIKKRLSLIS